MLGSFANAKRPLAVGLSGLAWGGKRGLAVWLGEQKHFPLLRCFMHVALSAGLMLASNYSSWGALATFASSTLWLIAT